MDMGQCSMMIDRFVIRTFKKITQNGLRYSLIRNIVPFGCFSGFEALWSRDKTLWGTLLVRGIQAFSLLVLALQFPNSPTFHRVHFCGDTDPGGPVGDGNDGELAK